MNSISDPGVRWDIKSWHGNRELGQSKSDGVIPPSLVTDGSNPNDGEFASAPTACSDASPTGKEDFYETRLGVDPFGGSRQRLGSVNG